MPKTFFDDIFGMPFVNVSHGVPVVGSLSEDPVMVDPPSCTGNVEKRTRNIMSGADQHHRSMIRQTDVQVEP